MTITAKWELPAATGTQRARSHTAPEAARAKKCLFFALLLSWVKLVARWKPQISAGDPFVASLSLVNGGRWRTLVLTALSDTDFPLHAQGIKVGTATAPVSCIWALGLETNTWKARRPLEKLRLWSHPLCFKFHAALSELRARNLQEVQLIRHSTGHCWVGQSFISSLLFFYIWIETRFKALLIYTKHKKNGWESF